MGRSINVLFINQPAIPMAELELSLNNNNSITSHVAIPLGILYLSSYLKKYNSDVKIEALDFAYEVFNRAPHHNTVDDIINATANEISFKPDVLAISAMFSICHPFLMKTIDIFSTFFPDTKIIVGGNHATNATRLLLENDKVDYVGRGECEESFRQFIDNFDNLDNVNIPGIYSKKDLQNKVHMGISPYVMDLDELPFPDWELVDMEAYSTREESRARNNIDGGERRQTSIMTTRGCPFSCTFCASHTVNGRKIRFRSIENVISEIQTLHDRYKINLFIPEDDLFTANRKKVVPLLNEIRKFKKTIPGFELQFPNALSVNTLFEDVMDALINANMKVTNIAIESGSEYVQQNVINKRVNLSKAIEVVKYFRDRNVTTRCYFIGGFPNETKEQMLETIDYAKKLKSDWCTFHIAAPLRGTEMYKQFVDMGYIKDEVSTWSTAFFQERSFDTPEISADGLKELFYRANLEVNFLNNPNLLDGNYDKALWIYKDIVKSYPFHVIGWYCIMLCYEAIGDINNRNNVLANIVDLIKTDLRARQLYKTYSDLLPKIVDVIGQPDKITDDEFLNLDTSYLSDDALDDDFLSSQIKIKEKRVSGKDQGQESLPKRPRSSNQAQI